MKKIIPLGEKKDINVNTLFPARLVKKLDERAWRNRLTRSAALRILVENAFAQQKEQRETTNLPKLVENNTSGTDLQSMVAQALNACSQQAIMHEELCTTLKEHSHTLNELKQKIASLENKSS